MSSQEELPFGFQTWLTGVRIAEHVKNSSSWVPLFQRNTLAVLYFSQNFQAAALQPVWH